MIAATHSPEPQNRDVDPELNRADGWAASGAASHTSRLTARSLSTHTPASAVEESNMRNEGSPALNDGPSSPPSCSPADVTRRFRAPREHHRTANLASNALDDRGVGSRCDGDSDLVRRCVEGDQRAWDALVEKYARLVYSIPARFGFCEADAADVFQTVFSIAFRSLGKLRDRARVSSWLITTTRRECWRKRRADRPNYAYPESVVDADASPEECLERLERQQLVREAMQELGWRDRAVLEALFMSTKPMSYDDISRQLGIPVGSIGPTRARALKKIEAFVRDSCPVLADPSFM